MNSMGAKIIVNGTQAGVGGRLFGVDAQKAFSTADN